MDTGVIACLLGKPKYTVGLSTGVPYNFRGKIQTFTSVRQRRVVSGCRRKMQSYNSVYAGLTWFWIPEIRHTVTRALLTHSQDESVGKGSHKQEEAYRRIREGLGSANSLGGWLQTRHVLGG